MAQLAIKGHKERGNEVIEILEMLGAINSHNLYGDENYAYYTIDGDKEIKGDIYVFGDEQLCYFTLEEFLEKFPYKVGDKVKNARINDFIGRITNVRWDNNEKQIIYVVEWDDATKSTLTYFASGLQPCKEETEIKINIPKGYEFAGIDDNRHQVVFTKIQIEYPNNYEECCNILGCKADDFFTDFSYDNRDIETSDYEDKIDDLLQNFRKLRYCRDAYWKIAGEQMGLGKPWEPDWNNDEIIKYCIIVDSGIISRQNFRNTQFTFAFPTEEMRDAFFNNFKELIEQCKELL